MPQRLRYKPPTHILTATWQWPAQMTRTLEPNVCGAQTIFSCTQRGPRACRNYVNKNKTIFRKAHRQTHRGFPPCHALEASFRVGGYLKQKHLKIQSFTPKVIYNPRVYEKKLLGRSRPTPQKSLNTWLQIDHNTENHIYVAIMSSI